MTAATFWKDSTGENIRLFNPVSDGTVLEHCSVNGSWTIGQSFPGQDAAVASWVDAAGQYHARLFVANDPQVVEYADDGHGWQSGSSFPGSSPAVTAWTEAGSSHVRLYAEVAGNLLETCIDNGAVTVGLTFPDGTPAVTSWLDAKGDVLVRLMLAYAGGIQEHSWDGTAWSTGHAFPPSPEMALAGCVDSGGLPHLNLFAAGGAPSDPIVLWTGDGTAWTESTQAFAGDRPAAVCWMDGNDEQQIRLYWMDPDDVVWERSFDEGGWESPQAVPSAEQIVLQNLVNLIALNDYIKANALDRTNNAYGLLAGQATATPESIGLDEFLQGLISAFGGELGPVGTFLSTILCGLIGTSGTGETFNLGLAVETVRDGIQTSFTLLGTQLAQYKGNLAEAWDTPFTYNGQTMKLSDLAQQSIPDESDPAFSSLQAAGTSAMDRQIWTQLLGSLYQIVHQYPDTKTITTDDPVGTAQDYLKNNPAYYTIWQEISWPKNTYSYIYYVVGIPNRDDSRDALPMTDDACQYLFIDSTDGAVINSGGLFPRKQVFTALGMRTCASGWPGHDQDPGPPK